MAAEKIPAFDQRYEALLQSWCDGLLALQIRHYGPPHDGGFLCKACTVIHGRADNALFPLMYMYAKTKDPKYYDGAIAAFHFQNRLRQPDGSVVNDGNMAWKGISVFSMLNIWKTLHYFSCYLQEHDKQELEKALFRLGKWIDETIDTRFETNINYYAAAAECLCHLGAYQRIDRYSGRIRELFDYCMDRFHEDGLFHGEIVPHDTQSVKGCFAVDMGYNFEETLLCLTETAISLRDETALRKLASYAVKMLDFMLPDGAINNTFGCRNNKWTYYGSRTSDGCLRAMLLLSAYEPVLYEAVCRNADLLRRCTSEGALYGGLHYKRLRQPACVHHTFCHAAGLADALLALPNVYPVRALLPYEKESRFARHYPEIDTWQIGIGCLLATVTASDFRGYTYANGAAHASGGAISMLYHKQLGPVMAGSIYGYGLTEMTNMQLPVEKDAQHRSLIMRWDYEKNGKTYTTCLCPDAQIRVEQEEKRIIVEVETHFVEMARWEKEDPSLTAQFRYELTENQCVISGKVNHEKPGLLFHLPIVENTMQVRSAQLFDRQKVFHLSGGLSAEDFLLAGQAFTTTLSL
ncbi:MAG: hypothetical protein IKH30_14620 [Clostridia bacterium]|nr:hypothetical protein [Clostridia bacterium]